MLHYALLSYAAACVFLPTDFSVVLNTLGLAHCASFPTIIVTAARRHCLCTPQSMLIACDLSKANKVVLNKVSCVLEMLLTSCILDILVIFCLWLSFCKNCSCTWRCYFLVLTWFFNTVPRPGRNALSLCVIKCNFWKTVHTADSTHIPANIESFTNSLWTKET